MSNSYLNIVDISKIPENLPNHPYSFPLDPFQKHAVCAIAKDEHVLVCAKTGSGKTLVGEYQIYHSLAKGKRVFYTTPIKSLSNQKFYDLKHQFSDATVGIMTGDIKFCPDAQIVIMTTEILRNLLYKKGTSTEHLGLTATISMEDVDAIIFDECHYINDKDRGKVWEETMILLPNHINMVMLSATLDRPEYLAGWLGTLKQRMVHLIVTDYRIVPLTHYVLEQKEAEDEYKMVTIMDPKEVYYESAYQKWIGNTHAKQREADRYARNVAESRNGDATDLGPKVTVSGFVHHMNRVVAMLQKEELLPALFFVLSRKQCEQYADKVEHTLLDSSDIAAVKHIISFHLHRHMKDLETVPQYHQIYKLLTRGIAFHHSGLLPILKEIVEILFSKGFVKLMFCTETFAVGLNMPTKTVLFAGLKKFDETLGGMRLLRHDEYIQMAGRAGRRGKDDKGVVIYMPDREAATPGEIYTMMKGARPPIHSRMDFHYDFILKSIQSSGSTGTDIQSSGSKGADIQSSGSKGADIQSSGSKGTDIQSSGSTGTDIQSSASNSADQPKWLQIMENSYWFEQRKKELDPIRKKLSECNKRINSLQIGEPYLTEITKRLEIEQKMKTAVNAPKKELQKQLDTLKNRQLGPKWNQALLDVQALHKLTKERDEVERELSILEDHRHYIQPFVEFLYQTGYIAHNDIMRLTQADLTLKGVLATEVNEGHPILMTEMYTRGWCHHLSGEELVCFLSCFQESKEKEVHRQLDVSANLLLVLQQLQYLADESMALEHGATLENYWNISTEMMEPMKRWMGNQETQPDHASQICAKYELFEGNFIRSIMKISNMLNEWLSMATYCQHTDQIEKILEVQGRLIRDLVVSDSLYLRL